MATYYVQIVSAWQGDRWRTCLKTENKGLAEYAGDALEIEENEYGIGNPGLTGRRRARVITKTMLQRESGLPAIACAERDIAEGWDDAEAPTKRLSRNSAERAPNSTFLWGSVMREIELIEAAYREAQEAKELEGKIDYLVTDIPIPLHAKWKAAAAAADKTMRELFLEILEQALAG